MPLYDYQCIKCGYNFEAVLSVAECDDVQRCLVCSNNSTKIFTQGHGGIWRKSDSLPWVRDVAKVLTEAPDSDRPNPNINTVDDLRNYYQTHPKVVPAESHPAFPSSLGDAKDSRPDPKEVKRKRKKQGNELLRKMRGITINSNARRAVQLGT